MHKILKNYRPSRRRTPVIKPYAIEDYRKGLRIVNNIQTLPSNFQTVAENIFVDQDGKLVGRFGVSEFAQTSTNIVDLTYFNSFLIAFLTDGTIEKVDSVGTVTAIWNTTIAAALPGAPSGWSATTHISFSEFDGELIVCNGIDKPILVADDLSVTYLQDLATGSNVNTPIGSHVTTVDNYVIIANIGNDKTIMISSQGTSGTWVGDPGPVNDSVEVNLSKYVGSGNTDVIGLANFKNKLIVFYDLTFLVVQLGVYASSVHVPDVVDVVQRAGLVSHQSMYVADEEIVFMSRRGVFTAKETVFSSKFKITPKSDNISKKLLPELACLADNGVDSFTVVDELEQVMFFFIKDDEENKHCYMMRYSDDLKNITWSTLSGWDFTCGCNTLEKRVFFGKDDKIYKYGNRVFENEKIYTDDGVAISIDAELPWLHVGGRAVKKSLKRLLIDTEGTAKFQIQLFRDKIYKDENDNYDPALTMDVVCGSASGYGDISETFGGERRLKDERYWGFPLEFKLIKIRLVGDITNEFVWSAAVLLIAKGHLQV